MPNKSILISLSVTLWSGLVSWGVARWTLSNQNRLNEKKDLVKLIEDVETEAVSYWLSTGRDKVCEVSLIGKLKKINPEIQRIYKKKFSIYKEIERELIDYRRNITGGAFETESRLEEPGRAIHIQDTACRFTAMIKDSK